ncbi:MAG: mechanosensitive ion channel, partial [Phycisphaerales bacterium]|nr:mechanosensitive ion channel [Phycisphaerales bacterium]
MAVRMQRDRARRGATGVRWMMIAALVFGAAGVATAQDAPPDPVTTDAEVGELAATEATVSVDAPAADPAIAGRLTSILEATGRFRAPSARVEEGVVFLTGSAETAEDREWASRLARRTQDVVGVINTMTVVEPPLWTMEPATAELRQLWRQVVAATPLVVIGLIVLLGTLAVAGVSTRLLTRVLCARIESELLRSVLEKVVRVAIVLLGVYLFLRISGLTRLAVTVVGGTGILGIVLGFAFRDIAENLLASILISVQRPFRIGDTITVDGNTGVVQKVTMRGTLLMDFEGNYIQITNATIYKSTIRNYTANPKVRADFSIGIGFDASITRAQAIAMEVLAGHDAVLAEPGPSVLVEELGAATIVLRVYFWVDGHRHGKFKVRSAVMRLIVRAFEREGISLPDEAREVVFPDGVPVRMLESGPVAAAPPAPPPVPVGRATDAEHDQATEAEGDLESDVEDLQAQ